MNTSKYTSVNPDYQLKKLRQLSVDEFADRIKTGDLAALSRAITLIESSKPENRNKGRQILENVLPHTGKSLRIAVTGVPGAGKSTFIEALGEHLISKGKKVAVLAIDPSSSVSGGSILGDKTRMPALSASTDAYVRPSPASGSLGGVARKTREAMLLCEAAGFDIVFVETVGVGQSETSVKHMTDFFLLLMLAGAGDELQGIKRGIMEMADLIAINKADGENKLAADRAAKEYQRALSLMPKHPAPWKIPVVTCSALDKSGIDTIWTEIKGYLQRVKESDFFDRNRKKQAVYWLRESIQEQLKQSFFANEKVKKELKEIEEKVERGDMDPFSAARELVRAFQATSHKK